jgi:hypothetical protein
VKWQQNWIFFKNVNSDSLSNWRDTLKWELYQLFLNERSRLIFNAIIKADNKTVPKFNLVIFLGFPDFVSTYSFITKQSIK